MTSFTDSDKDHLFGLLERILRTNIMLARVEVDNAMQSRNKETLDEAERYLNK